MLKKKGVALSCAPSFELTRWLLREPFPLKATWATVAAAQERCTNFLFF